MYSTSITRFKGYKGGSALLTALTYAAPIAIDIGSRIIKAIVDRKKQDKERGGAYDFNSGAVDYRGGWYNLEDSVLPSFQRLINRLITLDTNNPMEYQQAIDQLSNMAEHIYNGLPEMTKRMINKQISNAGRIMGNIQDGLIAIQIAMSITCILDSIRLLYSVEDDEEAKSHFKEAYSNIENKFFMPGIHVLPRQIYIGIKKLLHNPRNYGVEGAYSRGLNLTRREVRRSRSEWSNGPFNVLPRLRNNIRETPVRRMMRPPTTTTTTTTTVVNIPSPGHSTLSSPPLSTPHGTPPSTPPLTNPIMDDMDDWDEDRSYI